MIRVGAVNIDTSHPMGFGEVMEKGDRARYVGVYNDSFRDDREVEGFIRRFGLEKRCSSLEELAQMSDIGFIHGCNWDDHLRCALPFIQMGKPVFIDKPIVGNLTDCEKLLALAQDGAVILGASSARYAYEIQQFLAVPEEERGKIVQVFGTAGVDEFNYGVHIAEALAGILGINADYLHNENDDFISEAQKQYGPRGKRQAMELVDELGGLFAGGELSEEDRDGVMQAMMDIYWETKQENKKYTPKKYRKPTE